MTVPPPQARWPPWAGPLALICGLVIGIVGGGIAAAVIPGGDAHGTLSPAAIDVATVIQDLGFVAAVLVIAARFAPVRARQLGLVGPRSAWQAVVLVPVAIVLVSLLAYAWFAALGRSGQEKEFVKEIGGNAGTLSVLAVCALVCVVAPICEELLFRGFIFTALRNWKGMWPAAIITGLLFGGVHAGSAPAVDLVPLAFLGFGLCLLYRITGSLYPCIAAHSLNNSIAYGSLESWTFLQVIALIGGSLLLIGAIALVAKRVGLITAPPSLLSPGPAVA